MNTNRSLLGRVLSGLVLGVTSLSLPLAITASLAAPDSTPEPLPTPPPQPTPAPIKWKPFVSLPAHLKIDFPTKPIAQEDRTEGVRPLWTFTSTYNNNTYRAIATIYSKPSTTAEARTQVTNAAKAQAVNGFTITERTNIKKGTYGRFYTMTSAKKVAFMQIFVQDAILYQLIVSGPIPTFNAENANAFFDSFQYVK